MIPTYWHVSDNFGDRMAPWLVRQITGRDAVYCDPTRPGPVPYLVTGSILGWSIRKGIVWGAGSAFASDLDPSKMAPPSESFRIVATRGPLSASRVREAGHKPLAYGDPGLLLPRFYTSTRPIAAKVGILCSWVDHHVIRPMMSARFPTLSSLQPEILEQILAWEVIVTNTLHGLVAAVAYGKPVVWTPFTGRLVGDGFKFRDFFASLGLTGVEPKAFDYKAVTEADFVAAAQIYHCAALADELAGVCPLPSAPKQGEPVAVRV